MSTTNRRYSDIIDAILDECNTDEFGLAEFLELHEQNPLEHNSISPETKATVDTEYDESVDVPNPTRPTMGSSRWQKSTRKLALYRKMQTYKNLQEEVPEEDDEQDSNASRWQKFTAELKYLFNSFIEFSKSMPWYKKVLSSIFIGVSVWVFCDLVFARHSYIMTWLHSFVVWTTGIHEEDRHKAGLLFMSRHHRIAVGFAFAGILVVSTLVYVPPSLLVFGAGYGFATVTENYVEGILEAIGFCFLGSCIGAALAFLLRSRFLMRDLVKIVVDRYQLMGAIDRALMSDSGLQILLLFRLCPIVPFNCLNDICGMSGVSLYHYTLSLVGILPFQIYTIILGTTARAIELRTLKNEEYTETERWALIGFISFGVAFGLVAIITTWSLVKEELKRENDSTARTGKTGSTDVGASGKNGESTRTKDDLV